MEKYTTSIDLGYDLSSVSVSKTRDRARSAHGEEDRTQKRVKKSSVVNFYFINILFGVVITVFILVLLAGTLFVRTKVEYEGVVNSNIVEIEKTLFSDKYSGNTLYAWISNMVKDYGEIPFVKNTSVYLKDKNTVVVSVKEDDLSGYIDSGEKGLVYFDQNGNVTEISRKLIGNVPIIEGVKIDEIEDGKPLGIDSSKRVLVTDILKYLKETKLSTNRIVFDRDNSCGFYVDNIFIDLGITSDVREKISRLPFILPSLEGMAGTLHMEEWGRDNSDIVFEGIN